MQKTKFPFEVIIHDDSSTDGTERIIREYESNYPEVIFPIYQKENQYSKGIRRIFATFMLQKCTGKYVALCEGDDYWTDPYKLQKQVDFLETHPDFALCVHNVRVIDERAGNETFITKANPRMECTIADVLENRYPMPTCSTIVRTDSVRSFPPWFSVIHNGDWVLQITASQFGKVCFMNDPMATYVRHKGGISVTTSIEYQNDQLIKLFHLLNQYLHFEYKHIIDKLFARVLMNKSMVLLKKGMYSKAVECLLQAFFTSPGACVEKTVEKAHLFVTQRRDGDRSRS